MDTTVLVLQQGSYKVIMPEQFQEAFDPIDPLDVNARVAFARRYKGVKKYTRNMPQAQRDQGKVYPLLTIYERVKDRDIYSCDLHISFSLTKIKYGHSFRSVFTEDQAEIIGLLISRLLDMGVVTTKEAILKAKVNTIHYALNIDFPSDEHTRIFLQRMSKVSIGGWFEKNVRSYGNDGQSVRFHSDTFQIVFYLKYYDLFESASRSIDRKRTLQEVQIAQELKNKGQIPPVVRIEIRFVGTRSVSKHFEAILGIKQPAWTFEEVFSTKLSKQVLRYYWNKITSDLINYSLLSSFSDEDVCRIVLQKYKNEPFEKTLSGLGIFYLLHSLGVKDVRGLATLRTSRATWYRERRNIVEFINRYVKANSELIDLVTDAINSDSAQLKIIEE